MFLTDVWPIDLHDAIQSSTSDISRGCIVVRCETKRKAICLGGLAQAHPIFASLVPILPLRECNLGNS